MTLEFRKINEGLRAKKIPDKMGEEGILNLVRLGPDDGREFFIKQWYGIGDKMLAVDAESGESPCSPFWVKAKYYEYGAIHDVFPDITVEMHGAFDPRITKDEEGIHHFSYDSGRPVTITQKVEGNPPDVAQRNEIIDKAYNEMLRYHKDTVHGIYATSQEQLKFFEVAAEADEEMQRVFGLELHIMKYNPQMSGHDILEKLLKNARAVNPQSPITKLLEFGIVPIHPEFNFIPKDQTEKAERPHGIFLEFTLLDQERFVTEVIRTLPKKQATSVIGKMRRFSLYRSLDNAYDSLMVQGYMKNHYFVNRVSPEDLQKYGAEVQDALFELFELIKNKFGNNSQKFNEIFGPLMKELRIIFKDSNRDKILTTLKEFKIKINSQN